MDGLVKSGLYVRSKENGKKEVLRGSGTYE